MVNLRATLDVFDNDIKLEEQSVKVIQMDDKAKEKMKSCAENVHSFELNLNEKQIVNARWKKIRRYWFWQRKQDDWVEKRKRGSLRINCKKM